MAQYSQDDSLIAISQATACASYRNPTENPSAVGMQRETVAMLSGMGFAAGDRLILVPGSIGFVQEKPSPLTEMSTSWIGTIPMPCSPVMIAINDPTPGGGSHRGEPRRSNTIESSSRNAL